MLHEDYGHYSYTEHYSLGDIFIYTSADEEKGVLLELKGRGCRQFESYLLAQQRSWYDFLMDALVDLSLIHISDASSRMSADQISDVALSLEYVKQYGETHKELNYKQVYLLEQCVVWQRLSVHLGWQCDNVRACLLYTSSALKL